eukprot:3303632-Pleurochrysis_carterae.AAC.1
MADGICSSAEAAAPATPGCAVSVAGGDIGHTPAMINELAAEDDDAGDDGADDDAAVPLSLLGLPLVAAMHSSMNLSV